MSAPPPSLLRLTLTLAVVSLGALLFVFLDWVSRPKTRHPRDPEMSKTTKDAEVFQVESLGEQSTEYMWNGTILPHDQPHLLAWDALTSDEQASVERFRSRVENNAAASGVRPVSAERLQQVAHIVYAAMQSVSDEGKAKPWVEGGNSAAQDTARRAAAAIVHALHPRSTP